jgi:hypothetical protein
MKKRLFILYIPAKKSASSELRSGIIIEVSLAAVIK